MAKHSSNKTDIKPLIPCPIVKAKDYGEMCLTVEPGVNGDTEVVVLRIPVGTPVVPSWAKNGQMQSGVLNLEEISVDIRGTKHYIRLNSGWKDGARVGPPEISIVPAKEVPSAKGSHKIAF